MKILFITQLLPYPAVTGGTVKTFKILEQLALSHDVWVATFHDSGSSQQDARKLEELLKIKVESIYRPETTFPSKKMLSTAFRSLFSFKPFRILKYFDRQMASYLRRLTQQIEFDALYLDHDTSYQYCSYISRKPKQIIYDEHNVDSVATFRNVFEPMRKPWTRLFSIWDGVKYMWLEKTILRSVDKIACISSTDRDLLIRKGGDPKRMMVLPVPYDTKNRFRFGSKTILFVGLMSWAPNKFGFQWFYAKVYPLIQKQLPGVSLTVVGKRIEDDLKDLVGGDSSVCLPGLVPNVGDYYALAGVAIVPIHLGGGIRIKLLEALAAGMPVVSTTLGAEGVLAAPVLLADKPVDFANSVITLLTDQERATKQSVAAVEFMRQNYSEAKTLDALKLLMKP